MNKNCRYQFTALLRRLGIKYETSPHYISIGHWHFHFDDKYDCIRLHTPLDLDCHMVIHYSAPVTILFKYHQYKQIVKSHQFYKDKAWYN